jgi:Flp pilus assembly pilin Flp
VIFEIPAQESPGRGFLTTTNTVYKDGEKIRRSGTPEQSERTFCVTAPDLRLATTSSPLDAAEGRCNRMDIRDWFVMVRAYAQRQEGQTMAEYGVVLAVITLGVIAVLGLLAAAISGKLGAVKDILNNAK